jgi:copper chaperone CopZ
MKITTAEIDGMMCPMCESHVNDAVRKQLRVRKVTSSHKKGVTVITSEEGITKAQLEAALEGSGYRVLSVRTEDQVRKGLFRR